MLSLEWQPNCSLCYTFCFSEWSIFHFQGWRLLIEAIDPKTSCLDWLLGGNAGITGIWERERMCDCVSLEGGKAGISLMKSYRKSMLYWKKKNALPRGGCTQAQVRGRKKNIVNHETNYHGLCSRKKIKVLCRDLRLDLISFCNLKKPQNGNQVLTRVMFYSTSTFS